MDRILQAIKLLDAEYKYIKNKPNWENEDIKREHAVAQACNILEQYRNVSPLYGVDDSGKTKTLKVYR